ncbi:MAG: hypothetical protein WCK39_09835 [Methanomassiliicoccales archaeon]
MDDDEVMQGPKKDFAGFSYLELIGVVAAVLGIIAAFMPWGKTIFGYIITGIDIDGIVTLIISFSALAVIVAWKDNETTRRTGVWLIVLSLIMLLFTAYDLISYDSSIILSYSAGFYLQMLSGLVLLIVGSLLCLLVKKKE